MKKQILRAKMILPEIFPGIVQKIYIRRHDFRFGKINAFGFLVFICNNFLHILLEMGAGTQPGGLSRG